MYRPSGLQACQLIGRPLVRVTGCPAATLSAGDTQIFRTPWTGASQDNSRPSGDNLAPKKVGLSNSFWRGIRGRLDIFGLFHVSGILARTRPIVRYRATVQTPRLGPESRPCSPEFQLAGSGPRREGYRTTDLGIPSARSPSHRFRRAQSEAYRPIHESPYHGQIPDDMRLAIHRSQPRRQRLPPALKQFETHTS
jgi:hypothetical protein